MKICVLQLARLGDILQTVPTLNALKRHNPNCEVHLVARSRFAEAAAVVESVDNCWELETHNVLDPIFNNTKGGLEESLKSLDAFVDNLKIQGFDRVINLSFSPFSSYLTHSMQRVGIDTVGYTRFSDGYFGLQDDLSSYFYSQVGVGRYNRVHLIDLFASVAGVELVEDDISVKCDHEAAKDRIVFHIGGSAENKSLSVFKTKQVLRKLTKKYNGEILLVGSSAEAQKAEQILDGELFDHVINLVGKTEFIDLFKLCGESRLILGPDSVFMQIASLLGVPAVNISFSSVNFWETGPISKGSRIIVAATEEDLMSDWVSTEVLSVLSGELQSRESIVASSIGVERFSVAKPQSGDFEWALIKALYLNESFPINNSENFSNAISKLQDVSMLALEQVESMKSGEDVNVAAEILNRVDQIIEAVANLEPTVGPMTQWLMARKVMIPPGDVESILKETESIFKEFISVLLVYKKNNHEVVNEHDRAK